MTGDRTATKRLRFTPPFVPHQAPLQLNHPTPAGSRMTLFHIEDWILCVSSAKLREILVLPRR